MSSITDPYIEALDRIESRVFLENEREIIKTAAEMVNACLERCDELNRLAENRHEGVIDVKTYADEYSRTQYILRSIMEMSFLALVRTAENYNRPAIHPADNWAMFVSRMHFIGLRFSLFQSAYDSCIPFKLGSIVNPETGDPDETDAQS